MKTGDAAKSAGRMDTREKLVRAAEKLMLRDGYSATRVDDVLRKAGLSKGSFYHFFDSKEALGLAALEHYYADRVSRLALLDTRFQTDGEEVNARRRGLIELAEKGQFKGVTPRLLPPTRPKRIYSPTKR